jgi:hypothetical protein
MMVVRNEASDLMGVQRSYFAASQMTYQIQLLSFGKKMIFEGRLFQELSAMMLESGAIHSAFGWSRKALHVR